MLTINPLKIYKSFFSILIALFLIQPCFGLQKKGKKDKKSKKTEIPQPFLRGIAVQVDLASPIAGKLVSPDIFSTEASVDVNLRNTWFPVWELGYASINHFDADGAQFTASGMFNRIGFNISLLKSKDVKKPVTSLFYVGLRVGYTSFNYNINNLIITDTYWNTTQTISSRNNHTTATWGEFVAGIRVDIFKNITLGWSARLKTGLSMSKNQYSPWYVPGFGIVDGSGWGFTYTIGYLIPLK